jgi:hypothetical protein
MAYPHWEYFLAIEDDLVTCSRFIEFNENNFDAYSIEFARILLASASEFDVVAKMICKEIKPNKNPSNINEYRTLITNEFPKFYSTEIKIPRYALSFSPWIEWDNDENPDWWSSYNKVKHERNNHFSEATLENVLLATSGLMCGLMYYYKLTISPTREVPINPAPEFFEPQWYGYMEPSETNWLFDVPDDDACFVDS